MPNDSLSFSQRWENFTRKWEKLIEKERKAEVEFHKREISSLTPEERQRKGRAIITDRISFRGTAGEELLYAFYSPYAGPSEIREGALVLITPYGKNPLKAGAKGVVWEKRRNSLTVGVKQRLKRGKYRVDLFVDETTFQRMKDALTFVNDRLKALLLGTSSPRVGRKKVSFFNPNLNAFQREAVVRALGSELFLIHGPFGTGKTTTLEEIIRQLAKEGKRVLVSADSNTAVDNLLERLSDLNVVRVGHPSRIQGKLVEASLFFKLEKHPKFSYLQALRKEMEKLKAEREGYLKPTPSLRRGMSDATILKVAKRGKPYRGLSPEKLSSMAKWVELSKEMESLHKKLESLREEIESEILSSAQVVFSTASTAFSEVMQNQKFDVVVFDEATQATLPSTLMALVKAEQWVLAGDHKQLPPTVLSEDKELKKSLFERWIFRFENASVMLRIQYRMNEKLMRPSAELFYDSKLIAHESVKGITVLDICARCPTFLREPFHFVDVKGREEERYFSKKNREEAEILSKILRRLLSFGIKAEDVGVITPYKEQRDLISSLIKAFPEVEVNTVDGFQGREKEVILLSLVRANEKGRVGFLKDYRRLNVSLTRAKRLLIALGNSSTLFKDEIYRRAFSYAKHWEADSFVNALKG